MSDTSLYFSTVLALPDDSVLVGGHLVSEGSDPTGTLLVHYNENAEKKWQLIAKIPDMVNGLALRLETDGKVFVGIIGRNGFFCEIDLANKSFTKNHQLTSVDYGYFEDIVLFKGSYYVCGSRRQIYTFDGKEWSRLDSGIFSGDYSRNDFLKELHTSDPFSDYGSYGSEFILSLDASNTLSVCGSNGFVAILDQEKNIWNQLDAPTNIDFKVIYGDDDGSIFIGAGGGILYSISQDGSWKEYHDSKFKDAIIRDILRFKGLIYCAAGQKVLVVKDGEFEEVEISFSDSQEINKLSVFHNVLWAVGDEVIFRFDGSKWTSHISPTNK
ncbi:MAG: hypothetical protein H6936_00470 [Burkholderiales bacterium]|nr:hypothetical protein [Nitrosomonas sp.]MCP5273329.1 hypothetical protein [Burkholderiales bacterium]